MSDRKQKANAAHGGFIDPEVATDNHDKVMLWLDANIESIVASIFNKEKTEDLKTTSQWERPITKGDGKYKTIVGYMDMLCTVRKKSSPDDEEYRYLLDHICFEVKSKITSIGEVIRQINQYKTFLPPVRFVIVSPDDRYSDILTNQGIYFVKCPSIEELS
jgi:hypothetical protein